MLVPTGEACVTRRSDPYTAPEWTKAGNRWGPWIYWPLLFTSVGLLVWRVGAGATAGQVVFAAAQPVVWVCLLVANRSARRRRTEL